MIFVQSDSPPGTIIVPTNEIARYTSFWACLAALQVPLGTALLIGQGQDVCKNFNEALRQMVGEWAFFLGDDHTFKPDVVLRLLQHGLDYVSPLCSTRKPPFAPVAFHELSGEERVYEWYLWEELPAYGLVEVHRAAGVALVSKKALDAVGDPWFLAGQGHPEVIGEDLYFQRRLRDLGFKIHVDVDTPIGHLNPAAVWPVKDESGWLPAGRFGDTTWVPLPRPRRA